MKLGLTSPAAGQPVSATLIRELMREIRANRPLSGKNTRTDRTPNGTHISAVGVGQRSSTTSRDNGCFAIRMKDKTNPEDDDEYVYANAYYRVGGKTYSAGSSGELSASPAENTIVALKVLLTESEPRAEIKSYASLESLNADESDVDNFVVPLYWFGKKNEGDKIPPVKCDFRIGAPVIAAEFGGVNT